VQVERAVAVLLARRQVEQILAVAAAVVVLAVVDSLAAQELCLCDKHGRIVI
jgi:hypothetical protein